MKCFKSIISIFLVVAIVCLLPGMTNVVSAASRELSSHENSMENSSASLSAQESEVQSQNGIFAKKDLREVYRSGIIDAEQLFPSSNASMVLASEATTEEIPDMMAAIIKVNPAFSLQNSNNESIDINTGSLNISYNLANMAGINGMDLTLDLRYSSLDSNTLDKGYLDSIYTILGYTVKCVKHSTYTCVDDITYAQKEKILNVSIQDYNSVINTLNGGPYYNYNLNEYGEFIVEEYYYEIVSQDIIYGYVYEVTTVLKPSNVSNNGLSAGWNFSIPYIKQIIDLDNSGNQKNDSKKLVLDNGKSFSLKNNEFNDTNRYEDDTWYIPDGYPGYAYYSPENVLFNNVEVANILAYKDGTEYYFNNNDICVGKQDRFGNQIRYTYDSQNRLSAIYDDFGRSIVISWGIDQFTVIASNGSSATVLLTNDKISSISYNSAETVSFSYVTRSIEFGVESLNALSLIPHVLLTEITHPNGAKTNYVYAANVVYRPDYSKDEVLQITERYDTVNGNKQNETYYTYNGCYFADYSYFERLAVEGNSILNSIWADHDVPCDTYAILSNYSTTVSNGIYQTTYHFNSNGYCCSVEVCENNVLLQARESLYWGDILYATRDVLMDSAGDAVSSFTIYESDEIGNLLAVKKYQSENDIHHLETAEYNNPYYFITLSTVENIRTTYTYSTDGKTLTSKKVYENNVLREQTDYTYDSRGNVLTEKFYILPGSQTVTTTYSYADNLTRAAGLNLNGLFCTSASVSGIKDSDGAAKANVTTSATHDVAGRPLSETDANGNVTSYTYNSRGRLIRTDYPDGTYETVTYDIPNNRTTTRNRAGYILVSLYDVNGNIVSVTESASNATLAAYTYDVIGRLSAERKYHTATTYSETAYTYDALDRVLSVNVYNEAGTLLSSETNLYDVVLLNGTSAQKVTNTVLGDTNAPSIVTAQYTDAYGRTIQASKTFEQVELAKTYEYDALDRLVKETDENGHSTQYTYNYAGKALTVTDALGSVLTYTYDSMGNVLTMTDALGNTTTYTYDVLGRLLTQSVPFDVGSAQITKYDYDGNGNLTMTRITNNAAGESTSYSKTVNTYDSMNRMVSTVSYDGTVATLTNNYTYNAYDKVQTMTSGGVTTTYTYNTRGEQTKVTDALNQNETYTYDLGGNLLTKTDRNGTTFTYAYDRLGRLLSESAVNGSKTEQKTYTYSMSGALISESDNDVTITRKYDCLGRLIEETETANNKNAVSRYAYTKTDERERYTQVYQNETILSEYYEYDAVGRLVKVYSSTKEWQTNDGTQAKENESEPEEPDPEPDLDPYDFDSYPNLTTYTITYGDGTKLCDFKLVPTSGTTLDFPVTYTIENVPYGVCFSDDYWALDIASGYFCVDSYGYYWGEYNFTYSDEPGEHFIVSLTPSEFYEGQIASGYFIYEGDEVINSVGTEYVEKDGDCMELWMYIEDEWLNFAAHSSIYTLASTDSTETLITTYGYDANGNRISMTNANGTSTTYAYNKANLVTSVQNMSGETVLSSHTYTYYLDGNIKTEIIDGETKSYEYDGLGRLTREVKSGILSADDIVYTYDARGNRATRTQGPATTTYTYDVNNRLLAETTGVSNTLYTYDNNGNTLAAMKDGTLVYSYTYGLFGTQDSYTSDAILYTYYTYRPDGLRHSIGDKIHIWDGANIVADVEGNDVTVYFRGINLIYAQEDGEQTYYHFNAHGDVVVLTNESGEKEKTYSYTSFGIEYNPSTLDDNPFRYCGEYYDTVSGTIYLRARYYNSDLGRFTQQDGWKFANPEEPLSLNLYTYCWNAPTMYLDPSGHFAVAPRKHRGVAAIMLAIAFTGDGREQDFSSNEDIFVSTFSSSTNLNNKVDENLEIFKEMNVSSYTFTGDIDFYDNNWNLSDLDLHLGVGKASYSMTFEKHMEEKQFLWFSWTTYTYSVEITLDDKYNFDEYREGLSISNMLNNWGYNMQKAGALQEYNWKITFTKENL